MTTRAWALAGVAAAVLLFPWIPGVPESAVINANLAGEWSLVAISLVVLTGWVGQISLGQGAFVGVGAFATGLIARAGLPFPANLPVVALIAGAVAAVLGVVALRVRGLYLAVATLIFAWMADAYLFSSKWLVGSAGASTIDNEVIGREGSVTAFDLSNKRVFYYVVLAAVAAAWFAAKNLRESKTGRAFFAVRGSEMAAVSLGVDVPRTKLLAFALSGALAGIAGNLIMTDLRTVTPVDFQFTQSLFYLSIAVVGGVASIGGAVASSILFAGLNELFLRVAFLDGWLDIVSVSLLLVVLLGYPAGLGGLGPMISAKTSAVWARWSGKVRRAAAKRSPMDEDEPPIRHPLPRPVARTLERAGSRLREALPGRGTQVTRRALDLSALDEPSAPLWSGRDGYRPSAPVDGHALLGDDGRAPEGPGAAEWPRADWRTDAPPPIVLPPSRHDRVPVLEAESVIVRFGGLTAVDNVTLSVREREIVGLIGPNGAGKTTTFNAIAGLNDPTEGRVRLFGEDATAYPVHVRAQMGVGRTFQLVQLFPQLSVFENLLVATHVQNDTGVFSHLALTDRAVDAEAEGRRHVRRIIRFLGLEEIAGSTVQNLPFGLLRQVEIARALVTRAPLLMLDEPASGLDNNETDELARLLFFIRAKLGVSILLIEHDVKLVTSVCDYIYVINRGAPLAEGTPREIQRNPAVVAAYLGEQPAETRAEAAAVAGV